MAPRRQTTFDEALVQMGEMALAGISGGRRAEPSIPSDLTLEQLFTDPKLASFPASAVQRALLRAADGKPYADLLPSPERREFHFGTDAEGPPEVPRVMIIRTGVRSGKSLIGAVAGLIGGALRATFRRPPKPEEGEIPDPRDGLVGVRPGELVRAPIVTPLQRQSRAAFRHCITNIKASPVLSKYLVKDLDEQAVFRRPSDGQEVLIEIIAASPSGDNLRSTWLAGVMFDEADFFADDDAAVNLGDNFDAAVSRLLPGAQAWVISSPWADEGHYNEKFTAAFGRPGDTIAFHSDTRSMNPTLDRNLEDKERARDPDKAAREFDGVPLSSNAKAFFPQAAIDACVKASRTSFDTHLPPLAGTQHYAGTDLGFRKNSSALGIARPEGLKVVLAYYEEKRPEKGKPLKPSVVVREFVDTCERYGAKSMRGDLHYADTADEEIQKITKEREAKNDRRPVPKYDEVQPTTERQTEAFTAFRNLMQDGRLEIPNDPRLLNQMKNVKSQAAPGGVVRIRLPKQGLAHGDVLLSCVLACVQAADSLIRPVFDGPIPQVHTYESPMNF